MSEAIQDYIRAINIRPTMAEAHANLASAYKDRYILSPSEGKILTVPLKFFMQFVLFVNDLIMLSSDSYVKKCCHHV